MSKFITIHMLKNYPVSRPNADDTGQQKETHLGGIPRSRISSQCLKRSVRNYWKTSFDPVTAKNYCGVRSKAIQGIVAERVKEFCQDEEQQKEIVKTIIQYFFDENFSKKAAPKKKKAKKSEEEIGVDEKPETVAEENVTDYLIFTSDKEIGIITTYVNKALTEGKTLGDIAKQFKKDFPNPVGITVDVAMCGRMQTGATNLEVYAAMQMAHSVGVNALAEEFDYFTAVDDIKEDSNIAGAGHLGSLSCNSSCYYIHANICFDKLVSNLDGNKEFAADACKELVKALAMSNPSGKANSFANNTLPDFIMVEVHDGQNTNLINAFEKPVAPFADKSLSDISVERLLQYRTEIAEMYGDFAPKGLVMISSTKKIDGKINLPTLCQNLSDDLKK